MDIKVGQLYKSISQNTLTLIDKHRNEGYFNLISLGYLENDSIGNVYVITVKIIEGNDFVEVDGDDYKLETILGDLITSKAELDYCRKVAEIQLEANHFNVHYFKRLWEQLDCKYKFELGKIYKDRDGELCMVVEASPGYTAFSYDITGSSWHFADSWEESLTEVTEEESKTFLKEAENMLGEKIKELTKLAQLVKIQLYSIEA